MGWQGLLIPKVMPFVSRRQQRWAFANKKPFAKRWAKETPSFAALPERKDTGTTAGASLSGPGGLLATPGMGGGVRKRFKAALSITTKPMSRSEAARTAALARWRGHTKQPPKPGTGRRRPRTEQERQAAQAERDRTRAERRQQAQAERDTKRTQERQENRAKVLRALQIDSDGVAALEALRGGTQPDPKSMAGFISAGLAEQAQDGSYRMTPAGRALLSAADAGDLGRAGDTISGARDRVRSRQTRQQAAAERKRQRQAEAKRNAPKAGGSGGGKKKKPKRSNTRQRRLEQRLARLMRQRQTGKSFIVYKSADGTPRWIARTTTAYRDRDREIIAIKALDADSQRMTAARQFGPLRMWHLGYPDPLDVAQPWGPGLDVGDCDFSTQIGTTRVESGTFRDAGIARRIAATTDQYELSPGFFHPPDQPDATGVFTAIRTFERSLVPIKYGRASNLFTGLTVKEQRMDPNEMERRFKAVVEQLRLTPEQAESLAAGLVQADKSASAQGIAYKSAAADTVVINGITYKAETPAVAPLPDVVIDGVTYKAMPPEFADEKAGDAEMAYDEGMDAGLTDAGMDDQALIAAIADAVVAKIAPMFGDMKMSELKAMLGGVTQKDAGRAQEIAALKAEQAKLAERLTQLTGDQPAVALPSEIEAALKSDGPTTPNTLPAPTDPIQSIAMATLPSLYQANPQTGAWNGWAPPVVPPAQR